MYNKAINENSDIVICDMADYYEDGTKKVFNCTKFKSVYNVTPSASNKIFKKDIIGDTLFLNNVWYEDFNFTTKILLKSPKISVISKVYYNCNARTISTMNNNNSIKNLDMLIVLDDLMEYAEKHNVYDENIFQYLVFNHALITTINRIVCQKNKEKNEVIKKIRNYCKVHLNDYKKQEFYKLVPSNRKIIANLNFYRMHNISKILIKAKSVLK